MIRLAHTILAILLLAGVSYSPTLIGEPRNGYLVSGNYNEQHVLTFFLGFRNNTNDGTQELAKQEKCGYEALVMIRDINRQAEDPPPFKVELSEGESTTMTIEMSHFNSDAPSVLLVTPKVTRHTGSCGLLVNSRLQKAVTGYTVTSENISLNFVKIEPIY